MGAEGFEVWGLCLTLQRVVGFMLKVYIGATQVKALHAEAEAAKSSLIAVTQPCNQSKQGNDKNDANEDANDDNNDDGDHDAEDYVTVRSSSSSSCCCCWCWCVMMMMTR